MKKIISAAAIALAAGMTLSIAAAPQAHAASKKVYVPTKETEYAKSGKKWEKVGERKISYTKNGLVKSYIGINIKKEAK